MANITIIDGHNHLFRAFYGVPAAARSKNGTQVNAIYGFFAFLRRIVSLMPGNKILVVFDSETGIDDKQKIRGTYKSNRDKEDELFEQLPYVKQILDMMGIRWLEHPKFEADDIIASLADYWSKNKGVAFILSNDSDFTQLVGNRIKLLQVKNGQIINWDKNFIKQKYNIYPYQYVEYLSIVGDKTDNISGMFHVGKKTASDLLSKYDTIKEIYKNLDDLPKDLRESFSLCRVFLANNMDFLSMNRQIPIEEIIPVSLPKTHPNRIYKKIAFYLDQLGLNSTDEQN